jgi:4-amino-4-deoxy-L-arabinose transferase-like glycosyltransferase
MANLGDRTVAPRRRSEHLLVALVLLTAVFAVIVRFVTTSPLWLDEALSVDIAALPAGDIRAALEHDGHPPFFYLLLHGWMRWFGDGDVAVRALSGIFGVAALPLAWLAGRRVGGARVAWGTVFALALSPFAVRYATEARMYALLMVLVLVGHLLVRRAVDERQAPTARLAGLALVTALLLWTHYWSGYVVLAVVATLAWWGRRVGSVERSVAVRIGAAGAVGAACFAPWLPTLLEQAAHTGTPWAGAARPTVIVDETLEAFGGGDFAEAGLLGAAVVVLFLLGLTGRRDGDGVRLGPPESGTVTGEGSVVVLTFAIGALAGFVGSTTYAPRYAAVVFPLVALVVGRGLAVLPRRVAPAAAVTVLAVLGVAGIGVNIVEDRTQAGVIAAAVATSATAADVVVVCPDQLGPAVRRALDETGLTALAVLAYPALGDGRFVDWSDYEERNDAADPAAVASRVLATVPADAAVWVVWNGSYKTFEGDCEALLDGLATARGPFRAVVAADDDYFEHADLVVFEAA